MRTVSRQRSQLGVTLETQTTIDAAIMHTAAMNTEQIETTFYTPPSENDADEKQETAEKVEDDSI